MIPDYISTSASDSNGHLYQKHLHTPRCIIATFQPDSSLHCDGMCGGETGESSIELQKEGPDGEIETWGRSS